MGRIKNWDLKKSFKIQSNSPKISVSGEPCQIQQISLAKVELWNISKIWKQLHFAK